MAKLTLYTKDNCPFCVAAKEWFNTESYDYEEVNLQVPENRAAFVAAWPNARTVPQIIIESDGELVNIGGWDELSADEEKVHTLLNND